MITVLVWTGFVIYLFQPVQSDHISHSFTTWLNSVVKKDTNGELIKQINELNKTEPGISRLLQRASILISNHDDAFDLPLAGDTSTDNVYRLLLTGWNFFKTGNAMGKPAVPNAGKTLFNPQANKLFSQTFSIIFGGKNEDTDHSSPDIYVWPSVPATAFIIAPLAGGIAIGAP